LRIIGLTGLQGAGKTEIAKVATALGIPCVRMGDIVVGEVKALGLEVNEQNVGRIATELREREGAGAIAKRCIPIIENELKMKGIVVVDGIRGMAEVEELKKVFGSDFCLVGVWANPSQRYSRVSSRKRVDDAEDYKRFREKDMRELKWGAGEALSLADHMIINDGTLEELREKAARILRRIAGNEVAGRS